MKTRDRHLPKTKNGLIVWRSHLRQTKATGEADVNAGGGITNQHLRMDGARIIVPVGVRRERQPELAEH